MKQMWLRFNLFIKRIFDFCASLCAIIILLPVWLGVAIWIKCDSPGPILFKQGRRTKNGRMFKMWKFRSMVMNAENMGTGLFSYENDPRITKAGAILRKTSIDELPQLFNVLMGDISLIGPRPCVTYELGDFDTLNKKYKKRFQMKGGITGHAQCHGRNVNSWEEKVGLDNEYIDRFKTEGIWMDIKIIIWSVFMVLKKENIHEERVKEELTDEENAEMAEEEIIRLAHLPDEQEL